MVIPIVAVLLALVAQQQPPVDSAKPSTGPDADKNMVVVRGCLHGTTLTGVTGQEYTLEVPSTLRLAGNRAMRRQLREINGHQVELSGLLKGVTNYATGALVKDTGKTKVYVGGTERRTDSQSLVAQQDQRLQPPTLDVSSFKDLAAQCVDDTSH